MKISVIIPVYNGERFVEKAILSAIQQPEVTEIVVVNDGSKDGTQAILEQLRQQNAIVKIYQHYNCINKGRSASRNLGLVNATQEYIAFLDADDYYLKNRFATDLKLFQEDSNIDGVYNAIGAYFYREASIREQKELQLYTVIEKINSKQLFKSLLIGGKGHFSIDGLTVKRSVFDVVGFFNEKLVVAEDTDLLWRMSLICHLEAGIIDKPLAMRGVHDANVFDNQQLYKEYIIKVLQSVLVWSATNRINFTTLDLILKQIWIIKQKEKNKLIEDIIYWASLFLPHYQLLFSILSIKYFPLIRYRQMLFSFLYRK